MEILLWETFRWIKLIAVRLHAVFSLCRSSFNEDYRQFDLIYRYKQSLSRGVYDRKRVHLNNIIHTYTYHNLHRNTFVCVGFVGKTKQKQPSPQKTNQQAKKQINKKTTTKPSDFFSS